MWSVTSHRHWPAAEAIDTSRLHLEPLRVAHAEEMAVLLDDQGLHTYLGGRPATAAQLRDRYARQVVGRSPDGTQAWLNWVVRERATGAAVGTVQATVHLLDGRDAAEVAWVIATPYQRRGYAGEAAVGMADWLRRNGADVLVAHVHPDHEASARVARRLGLRPSDTVTDGEIAWTTAPDDPATAQ